jgi:hypothetical protein
LKWNGYILSKDSNGTESTLLNNAGVIILRGFSCILFNQR